VKVGDFEIEINDVITTVKIRENINNDEENPYM